MLAKFKKVIDNEFSFLYESNIYLAISGGKDSMALSHLLNSLNIKHTLLHCNFQLRGEESDNDELFVINHAKQNKLQIETIKFDTIKESSNLNLSIQETARNLRYKWFNSFLRDKKDILLTAHHLDDSIETFFINLMRGTSIQGLTGINNNRNRIVRPLSKFSSAEIQQYLLNNNYLHREDSSNSNKKYLRNKLRKEIIPLLSESTSNFETKMDQTMRSINDANKYILKQVELFQTSHFFTTSDNQITVTIEVLTKQDPFFLERIFNKYGVTRKQIGTFKDFLNTQSGATYQTTNYTFYINRGNLIIESNNSIDNYNPITISSFPFKYDINGKVITFTHTNSAITYNDKEYLQLDLAKIKLPLTLRPWKHGDKFIPLGLNHHKKVSDILIDKKIGIHTKKNILVCQDSTNTIICILSIAVGENYKITSQSSNILLINYSNK